MLTFDADRARLAPSRRARIDGRAANPCIGRERADLVLGGCAILEAICATWPVGRAARRRSRHARGHPDRPDDEAGLWPDRDREGRSRGVRRSQGPFRRSSTSRGAPAEAAGGDRARGAKRPRPSGWTRQLNDPYVAEARGAATARARPSSWSRSTSGFASQTRARGSSISAARRAAGRRSRSSASARAGRGASSAIDLQPMDPMPGATILAARLPRPGGRSAIAAALGGPADAVMSDMAAPATGHPQTDHLRIMALAEAALDFAERGAQTRRHLCRQGASRAAPSGSCSPA